MGAMKPITVTSKDYPGISAKIYHNRHEKNGSSYDSFTLAYYLLGKLKRETFADLNEATAEGKEAIKRIASGEQSVLELKSRDREIYLRATGHIAPLGIELDVCARDHAALLTALDGRATPIEAIQFFLKQNSKTLPRITVRDAVDKCLLQAEKDGKSKVRMHELDFYLDKFADSMQCEVSALTPDIISQYLSGLNVSDRTKANCRAVLAYFGRWLVLRGYLERGTNLLENVQKYSKRNGKIHIFTPAEISRLIEKSSDELLPYLVIGAFAGLRGAEILRLDWSEVDLQDGFIEVKAENAKTDVRRLVPIKPNLAAWLRPLQEKSGPVCSLKSISNYFLRLVAAVNKVLPEGVDPMVWKKNALRHSCISYRIAECADVARVADESGNSPAIIRTNYLRRVKPARAAEWFGITPVNAVEPGKISKMA
jgi:integrase